MRFSLRAVNRCRDCEATFEPPLGEDLVSRCPKCNSFATEVVARSGTRPFLDSALGCVILSGVALVLLVASGAALSAKVGLKLAIKALFHQLSH